MEVYAILSSWVALSSQCVPLSYLLGGHPATVAGRLAEVPPTLTTYPNQQIAVAQARLGRKLHEAEGPDDRHAVAKPH